MIQNRPKTFHLVVPKFFQLLEMKSVYQFVAKNLVTSDLSPGVAGADKSNNMCACKHWFSHASQQQSAYKGV